MGDKSTLSITKDTAEQVKNIRRQLSYSLDRDLTIDETISELCKERQERFNVERGVESTTVETQTQEEKAEQPQIDDELDNEPELDDVIPEQKDETPIEIKRKGKKSKTSTLDV